MPVCYYPWLITFDLLSSQHFMTDLQINSIVAHKNLAKIKNIYLTIVLFFANKYVMFVIMCTQYNVESWAYFMGDSQNILFTLITIKEQTTFYNRFTNQ